MFREPSKSDLKAAAGWTLAKRSDTTPEHAAALDEYRDGCVALLPFASEKTSGAAVAQVAAPLPSAPPPRMESTGMPDDVLDVIELSGQRTCRNGGRHFFSPKDSRCKWCGLSHLEAKGRVPELMRVVR